VGSITCVPGELVTNIVLVLCSPSYYDVIEYSAARRFRPHIPLYFILYSHELNREHLFHVYVFVAFIINRTVLCGSYDRTGLSLQLLNCLHFLYPP
jgi:hypothetical protein